MSLVINTLVLNPETMFSITTASLAYDIQCNNNKLLNCFGGRHEVTLVSTSAQKPYSDFHIEF